MKVGGLKLKVAEIFSWGINYCLLNRSNLASSYCCISKSWALKWALGLMIEKNVRKVFLGFNTYNTGLGLQCM